MASCIREPGGGGKPKELIKICTVDDDERDLLMMGRTLEKSGEFACVGAYRCADEALDGVPKVAPQVVLMDVRMPGMSGIECARRLKSLLPGLLVIFVTGLFDAATMTEASQVGDDYLLKPLAIAQCLTTIGFALKRRSAAAEKAQTNWARPLPPLNSREVAVMERLAEGLLYKEIEGKLGISGVTKPALTADFIDRDLKDSRHSLGSVNLVESSIACVHPDCERGEIHYIPKLRQTISDLKKKGEKRGTFTIQCQGSKIGSQGRLTCGGFYQFLVEIEHEKDMV